MKIINLWFYLSARVFVPGNPRIQQENIYSGAIGIAFILCVFIIITFNGLDLDSLLFNKWQDHLDIISEIAFIIVYALTVVYYRAGNRGKKIIQRYQHLSNKHVVFFTIIYMVSFVLFFYLYDRILCYLFI